MRILVDSLPERKEECIFRDSCPEYDICHDPENCLRLTSVKFKVHLDEKDVTKNIIKKLKIMPDLIGHDYIIRAIAIMKESDRPPGIMRIYERVGDYFGCSWKSVERDIRTAINKAHLNFDDEATELWRNICGTNDKVQNNSFLKCLCDYVGLKMSGLIE